MIDENANQGKYVVFDFDNTSVIFDIQEALLIYQIENLQFKIDPADMEAVLETGIPDLNKSMGTSLDGKNITPRHPGGRHHQRLRVDLCQLRGL